MKKIISAVTMMVVFLMTGLCYAGDVYVWGTVKDQEGNGIPGVTLRWDFITGPVYVTTGDNGGYGVTSDRNWCGQKTVTLTKSGCINASYQVRDDTCCDCDPLCDPADPSHVCQSTLRKNFPLVARDVDNDGVFCYKDNCPGIPNGPDLGTCSSGTDVGDECSSPGECRGCTGHCSMAQEDSDNDGIGDVCDSTPFQADALDAPSFYLACAVNDEFNDAFPYLCDPGLKGATEGDLTQQKLLMSTSSRGTSQTILTVLGLLPTIFCFQNDCGSWQCWEQMVADILDGADFFLGYDINPDKPPLPECPDRKSIGEIVEEFMKFLFELRFGYPPPERTE